MKRTNAGYEIITAVALDGQHEIVIGKNEKAPLQYVTWYCYRGNDYNVGAYTDTYKKALKNLQERVKYAVQAKLVMD